MQLSPLEVTCHAALLVQAPQAHAHTRVFPAISCATIQTLWNPSQHHCIILPNVFFFNVLKKHTTKQKKHLPIIPSLLEPFNNSPLLFVTMPERGTSGPAGPAVHSLREK